jgi:alpha-tubulin suppressor-like RCC1 family protein
VDIDKIAACGRYSLFADTTTLTKVYGCGLNSDYLLSSTNLNGTISTPTHMTDFDNATLIAAGPELCGVAKSNSLTVRGRYDFTWDSSTGTQYYNPIAQSTASTVLVSGSLSGDFIDLCIGNKFLLAIQNNNSLWGYVFYDDDTSSSNIPYTNGFPIGRFGYELYNGQIDMNASYYPMRNRLVEVDHTQNWRKIVCGRDHILLIDDQNKIYSWGDNTHNQLARTFSGHDVNITEITGLSGNWNTIACGPYNSFGILNT